MEKRDPRIDPKKDDRILYGPPWQREVALVVGQNNRVVIYTHDKTIAETTTFHAAFLDDWREWMRGAEVLHVAE